MLPIKGASYLLNIVNYIALSVLAFTGLVAGSGEALPRGLAAAAWVFVAGSFASLFIVLLFFRTKVNLSLFNALRGNYFPLLSQMQLLPKR